MRAERRALSEAQRDHAARRLSSHIHSLLSFKHGQRLAFYIANDGELSPKYAITRILKQRRQCFLPMVHGCKLNRMRFAPFDEKTQLIKNRYGIPEPKIHYGHLSLPYNLTTVFMPLVAFDKQGNRLGMGGGYYDRTFAYLRRHKHVQRPRLVGVAYDFQEVDLLPVEPWDVPLDAIITESRIIEFNKEK